MASLRHAGTFPSNIELLTILVMTGTIRWICSFSNHVGHGSRQQEAEDDFLITFRISSQVAGLNVLSRGTAVSVKPRVLVQQINDIILQLVIQA